MGFLIKSNGTYYMGGASVPPTPGNYLWFTPHESTGANLSLSSNGYPDSINIQYKVNNGEWTDYTFPSEEHPYSEGITLNYGDKVYFRGNNNHFSLNSGNYYQFYTFDATLGEYTTVDIGGDLTTLLSYSGNVLDISNYGSRMFNQLFRTDRCKVIDASQLVLPSTALPEYCYSNLFAANGSGTSGSCLVYAPLELPATTLSAYCYNYMFNGQNQMITSPYIRATVIADHSFRNTFNATGINSIKIDYTGNFDATNFQGWVSAVPSEGTMYYNGEDRTTGNYAIPYGWTVESF